MSGAHTPGPWATEIDPIDGRDYATLIVTNDPSGPGTWVARTEHNWNQATHGERRISWAEAQVNARLIAAAPDLLEALEEAKEELAYFVEFARQQCEFSGDIEAGYSAIRKCLAAIAKARGQ